MKWVYSDGDERAAVLRSMLLDLERDAINADSDAIMSVSNRLVEIVKEYDLNNVEGFIALYTAIETLASETPKALKAAFTLNGSYLDNLRAINQAKVSEGIAAAMMEDIQRQVFGVPPDPKTERPQTARPFGKSKH
jgi:hypothetical protein